MRQAEEVTFGGSGLDRRADLRCDPAALDALASGTQGRHIALWQGKPMVVDGGRGGLVRMAADAAPLEHAAPVRVFLGLEEDGGAVFAHDVTAWQPPEGLPETLGAFRDPSRQAFPGGPEDQEFCELRAVMADLTPREAELAATAKAVLGWHLSHRFCSMCGEASVPSQGGWQRDCPSCGAHHFPRTDPVVIMLITHGNSVLMGRSPGWPEGMYSLLAGFVEPGETIEAAVRREVLEEANIPVGQVDYLASQPWAFPSSLMFGCRSEALATEITVDPKELEHAMWVSREEMLSVFAGDHAVLRRPRRGAIAGFLIERWLADRLD